MDSQPLYKHRRRTLAFLQQCKLREKSCQEELVEAVGQSHVQPQKRKAEANVDESNTKRLQVMKASVVDRENATTPSLSAMSKFAWFCLPAEIRHAILKELLLSYIFEPDQIIERWKSMKGWSALPPAAKVKIWGYVFDTYPPLALQPHSGPKDLLPPLQALTEDTCRFMQVSTGFMFDLKTVLSPMWPMIEQHHQGHLEQASLYNSSSGQPNDELCAFHYAAFYTCMLMSRVKMRRDNFVWKFRRYFFDPSHENIGR